GDEIVYTGHGGKDPNTGKQVRDQKLTVGNLALARSELEGLPIRVVRGSELDSPFAPAEGYRYDGLYCVEEHWSQIRRSRFLVWRYRRRRYEHQPTPWHRTGAPTPEPPPPEKTPTTILRIVRSTPVVRAVKKRHNHRCQVCRERISTSAGPYAEGAHV